MLYNCFSYPTFFDVFNQPGNTTSGLIFSINKNQANSQISVALDFCSHTTPLIQHNWFMRYVYGIKDWLSFTCSNIQSFTADKLHAITHYVRSNPKLTAIVALQSVLIIVLIKVLVAEHRKKALDKKKNLSSRFSYKC